MVPGAFPAVKLGILAVRQISKPLANKIKQAAKRSPFLSKYVCIPPAQAYHWLEMNIKMKVAKMSRPAEVTPLNDAMAVELGSELLGEAIIFGTAVGTLLYEYRRNAAKERAKEEACMQRIEDIHIGLHKLQETVQEQQQILTRLQQSLNAHREKHRHRREEQEP